MATETRSFDDVVMVTSVARYTRAERSGLVAGDLVLSFGTHKPSELKEDPELIERIGPKDWLTILRGPVYFKMQPTEGIEGASFEPATPIESVEIPVDGPSWFNCTTGQQADGTTLLLPEHISPFWSLVPVMLYTRYRLWQMLTGSILVYGIAALFGTVPFLLTYFVASLPVLTSGSYLLKSFAEKQGYAKRGDVMIASASDAAAFELETAKRVYAARHPAPVPKPEPALDAAG